MNYLLNYFCGGIVVADEDTTTGAVDPGVVGRSILFENVLVTGKPVTAALVKGILLTVVVVTVVD